ncbi:unnamed protein product [Ambrosiozyma monospora]|uniref:Unnamed protein product n=1 Tax=Ambrosiozyma monospora TaxID=43982 RepID=A0ACB5T656_AMBMO|nr:unnamed protein product [Ambrosiozyma monospora]
MVIADYIIPRFTPSSNPLTSNNSNSASGASSTELLSIASERTRVQRYRECVKTKLKVHYLNRILDILTTFGYVFKTRSTNWKNGKFYSQMLCHEDVGNKKKDISLIVEDDESLDSDLSNSNNNNTTATKRRKVRRGKKTVSVAGGAGSGNANNNGGATGSGSTDLLFPCQSRLNFSFDSNSGQFNLDFNHLSHKGLPSTNPTDPKSVAHPTRAGATSAGSGVSGGINAALNSTQQWLQSLNDPVGVSSDAGTGVQVGGSGSGSSAGGSTTLAQAAAVAALRTGGNGRSRSLSGSQPQPQPQPQSQSQSQPLPTRQVSIISEDGIDRQQQQRQNEFIEQQMLLATQHQRSLSQSHAASQSKYSSYPHSQPHSHSRSRSRSAQIRQGSRTPSHSQSQLYSHGRHGSSVSLGNSPQQQQHSSISAPATVSSITRSPLDSSFQTQQELDDHNGNGAGAGDELISRLKNNNSVLRRALGSGSGFVIGLSQQGSHHSHHQQQHQQQQQNSSDTATSQKDLQHHMQNLKYRQQQQQQQQQMLEMTSSSTTNTTTTAVSANTNANNNNQNDDNTSGSETGYHSRSGSIHRETNSVHSPLDNEDDGKNGSENGEDDGLSVFASALNDLHDKISLNE